ncbi:ABC1 family-domain-containing protein [Cokeromyces recurvatus]|uniref:ABC1 family-domain-containing protein n=1 Tax=Cokeromyces recurvatus TaxID=90255 RepID=UPI00221F9B10|nr:ABC1 family-domain-containing protein [Cokeromyces recurvatus]KAI7898593.1 ABC1 family-domain-containing protein [Cokeromyces recurvatus]
MSIVTKAVRLNKKLLFYRANRLYTTQQVTRQKKKYLYLGGTTAAVCSVAGFQWYESDYQHRVRHFAIAMQRISIATKVGINVALDYKRTQMKKYETEEKRLEARQQCHQRCAERVLDGLQRLGGIYVKLGQHVSAMTYILPLEWTTTLAVLQDRCDPSSAEDIRQLFLSDYGQPLDEVFDEFDWTPLGVASLAQVHKARLRQKHEWVAVKFQHPRLDEFSQIDLTTVTFLVDTIKRIFPDFGFEWILQEMKESLPQEMNFEHEADNSYRVKKNFEYERKHHTTALVVPDIVWAKRRILCMEFIEGARIDNMEYMKTHGIDPSQVSTEITQVFSKMMFLDGFVHCDPHPGNILIRPAKDPKSKFKFDLVLLDHGLYRTLTDELRTDYAHLWTSLIRGDEEGIRKYSLRVGCRPESHRLFASLLTGREWSTIEAADLSSDRTITEVKRVSGRAKNFVTRIYDILETLPRIVLLLLKTCDLLRGLDETLRQSGDKYMTYALMGKFCAEAVWLDAKSHLLSRIRESSQFMNSLQLIKSLIVSWWEYQSLEYGLWFYRLQANARTQWSLIWHRSIFEEEKRKYKHKPTDIAALIAPLK